MRDLAYIVVLLHDLLDARLVGWLSVPISPARTQAHALQGTSSASTCSSAWRTCWTEDMGVSALVFWGSAQFFGVYSFSRHCLCSSRFVLARPRRGDRQRPQRRRGGARQRSTRRTSHVVRRSGSETPGPRGFMSLTITCECRSWTHKLSPQGHVYEAGGVHLEHTR